MNNDKDNPIKWDISKKEQKDRERAEEAIRKKVLKLCRKHYDHWKQELTRKPLPEKELVPSLYKLQEKMIADVEGVKELADWRDFTINLIEDMIVRVMAGGILKTNDIEEYRPSFGQEEAPDPNELVLRGDIKKARRFKFRNFQDFCAVPFVTQMAEKEGFVGFLRKDEWVMALFSDGESIPVGKVSNIIGIESLPTWEAFQDSLRDGKPPEGKTPEVS